MKFKRYGWVLCCSVHGLRGCWVTPDIRVYPSREKARQARRDGAEGEVRKVWVYSAD